MRLTTLALCIAPLACSISDAGASVSKLKAKSNPESYTQGDRARIEVHRTSEHPASATVALFDGRPLWHDLETGDTLLKDTLTSPRHCGSSATFCPDTETNAWKSHPSTAACSGVLLHERIVATARHCVNRFRLGSHPRVVFGFVDDANAERIEASHCFRGKKAKSEPIYGGAQPHDDVAFLVLDEAVPRSIASPVTSRATDSGQSSRHAMELGEAGPAFAYGHPMFMPRMKHWGSVFHCSSNGSWDYWADFDLGQGSSGSPVYMLDDQETPSLLGIFVVDHDSFARLHDGCCRFPMCPEPISRCEDFSEGSVCGRDRIALTSRFDERLRSVIKHELTEPEKPSDCTGSEGTKATLEWLHKATAAEVRSEVMLLLYHH